jgi:glycosyltransferase 2 family protein
LTTSRPGRDVGGDPEWLNRRFRQAAAIAALAVFGYLLLLVLTDSDKLLDNLARLTVGQWSLLLGLSLANYYLRFARWHWYLTALGETVPAGRHLLIYLAGFAFAVTPGKAGEALRSVYLRDDGVRWSAGLAALAAERVLDLAALAILAAVGIRMFVGTAAPALVLVALIVTLVIVGTRANLIRWVAGRLPGTGRTGRIAQGAASVLDDARRILVPGRLIGGLVLGVFAWGAEALGFLLLLHWLAVDVAGLQAISIYAVSLLAGAASLLPGGLGGAEAVMVALLRGAGAEIATAVLATLICRAVTLWFAVALGLGAVSWLTARRRNALY